MAELIVCVPPTSGGTTPTVSLHETPHALESYQVTFELDGVELTFQGRLDDLHAHFQAAHEMLMAFIFRYAPPAISQPEDPDECDRSLAARVHVERIKRNLERRRAYGR